MNRNGEKIGWIGGCIGGFIWVFIFSIIWFVQGKLIHGSVSIVLFIFALFLILNLAPWKHQKTKYWKLLLPIYLIFILSILIFLYILGGFNDLAKIQYGFWIFPCLAPFVILGRKTWN